MTPIEFGDTRNIVAVLRLDRQSLEWLESVIPSGDSFSKECRKVIEEIDAREAGNDDAK